MIIIVKLKLLSMPIWLGLFLALFFPYWGLNTSKWGFTALLILSFLNTFIFNFKNSISKSSVNWKNISFNLIIGYTLFPALQLLLAKLLLDDASLQLGVMLASIAPIAIVTPQFLSAKEEIDSAILYILISTLLYPLLCFAYFSALGFERFGIHIVPLIKDVLILTLTPVLLSLILEFSFPKIKDLFVAKIKPATPWVNMTLIGFLVFIYFGSSFTKTNVSEISPQLWLSLIILAFSQDFLSFLILRLFKQPKTEQICFSIKNVALSGGALLVFHPQGILTCSSVLIAHAVVYTLLSEPKAGRYLFRE